MRMCKFLLTYFVASATFFATLEAGNALALNQSSSENPRIINWTSTSNEENKDGTSDKLEIPKPKDLEKSLEESNSASEEIEDPNSSKPIRRQIKRCIDPISKRIFKCPFYKRKRSNQQVDVKKTLLDTRTLRNLLKKKLSRETENYRLETDNYRVEDDEENDNDSRRPNGNGELVTVVVAKNELKGTGKKKFVCRCHEDNCRGKNCEPFRLNPGSPYAGRPNPGRPKPERLVRPLYGPDILHSDRTNKDDSVYYIGPIYDPVYYIQNIQREQQKLLDKANSRNLLPNSPVGFPQNPLTQYSNIGQPVYYFNTPGDGNPNLGSARNRDSEIRMKECIRLHGRDFCVHSTSTEEESLEEPVLGAGAPEYDEFEGDDYPGEYDEATESWYRPLEPLEPDDDTLGIFYDDGEEYYPPKAKVDDSDEAIQHQPKESVGKASKLEFQTTSHESELVTESQSKEMLGSVNSVTEAEESIPSTVENESEEILGSELGEQSLPDIKIELKEKTTEPVSEEMSDDIVSVLGKMCTIETKKSLEVTKDKTCVTENKQYTFSNEEHTEDSLTEEKIATSEEKETEDDTIEKPESEKTVDSAELDQSTLAEEIHSYEDLSEKEQEVLQSAIETALNNFDPQRESTEEEIVGSAKETDLPSLLGTPIIRDMFALPQVENMITDSVRGIFSTIPEGNLMSGIANEVIKTCLRKIIKDVPIRNESSSIEVEEHKAEDGEWCTERVTLLPEDPQVGSSEPPERVLEEVESILSSPGVGKEVFRRPYLQNVIMQAVRNSLKSDDTVSRAMISDGNIQNAMNVALSRLSAMTSGVSKEPDLENSPVSGGFKDLPSISVTERTFKSGKWVMQRTKIGDESEDGLVGAEKPTSLDSEEMIGKEPPVDINNGKDKDEDEEENEDKGEGEEEDKETPAVRKYETGAAKAVTASSRSRPMTPSSTEPSPEDANPVSSESEDLEIDDSEEIIEKPIKYYSPLDRLMEYKKNHQKEFDEGREEPEDSEVPGPRSKTPLITQPKQFQTEEDDEIVGMAEGSGMFEEGIEEEGTEEEGQKVGYFEDYEASGSRSEDQSLDKVVSSPIENDEGKDETTTVAENENIDDQYTSADFTEVSEDSWVGSSRGEIDRTPDDSPTVRNNNNKPFGSSRKFDSLTDRTPDEKTADRSNNDDQFVGSRNFHSITDRTPGVRTTVRKNNNKLGSSRKFYSATERNSDARPTVRNNNKDEFFESKLYSLADRTPDDRQTVRKNNNKLGSSRKFYSTTERTSGARPTVRNNNKDEFFESKLYSTTDRTLYNRPTVRNNNNRLLGSSRQFYSVTDRIPDDRTTYRSNNNDQFVGSRNFYSTTDRTLYNRPTVRNNNNKLLCTSRQFYSTTDRTPDDRRTVGNNKNHQFVGSKNFYSVTERTPDEDEMMDNGPLIGEARNEEADIFSSEIYYIPKSSDVVTEDRYLGPADSNSRHDPTYLGRLLPLYRNSPRDLGNSDLVYVGDGVKLPLKIIKLNDGSFSLALSDRLCKSGVSKRANDENSMKADDQERNDEDCFFGRCFKKEEKGEKTSVDDSGKLSTVSSEKSKGSRKEEKNGEQDEEDRQYENYVQTLLEVNDIPKKDRANFVVNALDRVVLTDDDDFSIKGKLEDWRGRFNKKVSILGKIQSEKNREIVGDRKYRGYDTSSRVEILKVILNWIKDLVFTATNRKS